MSRDRRRVEGDVDEVDVFHDSDFDVDDFLRTVGNEPKERRHQAAKQKAAWQQLDERNEVRRLRKQLEDWDDWDRD